MTFDKVLEDSRLWAVRYDEENSNCLELLFSSWYDIKWLHTFFTENIADLSSFFEMRERSHTMAELAKMEKVRNYLLDCGVYDLDGFTDLIDNEQGN